MWVIQHTRINDSIYGPFLNQTEIVAWFHTNLRYSGDYRILKVKDVR